MYPRITVQTTRTSKRGIFLQTEIEFLADDEPAATATSYKGGQSGISYSCCHVRIRHIISSTAKPLLRWKFLGFLLTSAGLFLLPLLT
jgi:hypothetical protein